MKNKAISVNSVGQHTSANEYTTNNLRKNSKCNIISEWKRCTKCGDNFPATREFFYADRRLKDGLYVSCKSCQISASNRDITRICYKMMVQRCTNPKAPNYRYYGAKGVRVCPEWLESYDQFLADMGSRPSARHSISRRGDVGDYCKENCSWQTRAEQTEQMRIKRAA